MCGYSQASKSKLTHTMKSQQLVGTVVQATKAEKRQCACTESCMIAKTSNSHDKNLNDEKSLSIVHNKKNTL